MWEVYIDSSSQSGLISFHYGFPVYLPCRCHSRVFSVEKILCVFSVEKILCVCVCVCGVVWCGVVCVCVCVWTE